MNKWTDTRLEYYQNTIPDDYKKNYQKTFRRLPDDYHMIARQRSEDYQTKTKCLPEDYEKSTGRLPKNYQDTTRRLQETTTRRLPKELYKMTTKLLLNDY